MLIWPKPLPIVTTNFETGELHVVEETLQCLAKCAGKKIKVVGIIGQMRTGKSFVMNSLLNYFGDGGFELGCSVTSVTQGIWIWGKEENGEITLVLDSEGLGDPEKSDTHTADLKRFVLLVLLSSFLILNISTNITNETFGKLAFVSDITDEIQTNKGDVAGVQHRQYFPKLLFLIRDFTLSLPDGCPNIQSHLDKLLELAPGNHKLIKAQNELKRVITTAFPDILCRSIVPPVNDMEKNLKKMETDENIIRPEFKKQLKEVTNFILENTAAKQIQGNPITAGVWISMLQQYVKSVNDPDSPCEIESSYHMAIKSQAKKAIGEGVELYDRTMEKSIREQDQRALPDESLLNLHSTTKKLCLDKIMSLCIGNTKENAVKEFIDLVEQIDDETKKYNGGKVYQYIVANNEKALRICIEGWNAILSPLKSSVQILTDKYKLQIKQSSDQKQLDELKLTTINNIENERRKSENDYDAKYGIYSVSKTAFDRENYWKGIKEKITLELQLSEEEKKGMQKLEELDQIKRNLDEQQKEAEESQIRMKKLMDEKARQIDELNNSLKEESENHRQDLEKAQQEIQQKIRIAQEEGRVETVKQLKLQDDAHKKIMDEEKKNLQIQLDRQQHQFANQVSELENRYQGEMQKMKSENDAAQKKLKSELEEKSQQSQQSSRGYINCIYYDPCSGYFFVA